MTQQGSHCASEGLENEQLVFLWVAHDVELALIDAQGSGAMKCLKGCLGLRLSTEVTDGSWVHMSRILTCACWNFVGKAQKLS